MSTLSCPTRKLVRQLLNRAAFLFSVATVTISSACFEALEPTHDRLVRVGVTVQAPDAATRSIIGGSQLLAEGVRSNQLMVPGGQVEIEVDYLDGTVAHSLAKTRLRQDSVGQRVVMPVDIALCIVGKAETAPCSIRVMVRLLDEFNAAYDSARVGPIDATQGTTVDVPTIRFRDAVSLSPVDTLMRVKVGQRLPARVNAIDANGQAMAGRTMTWRSLDQSVATVDADGRITGVAVGRATIEATYGALNTRFVVKVPIVESLTASFSQGRVIATVPSQINSTIAVRPGYSNAVTYESSNTSIATVDAGGAIQTIRAGTVAISAIPIADASDRISITLTVDQYRAITSTQRQVITGDQTALPSHVYGLWGTRSDSLVAGGCQFISRFDGTNWKIELRTTFCAYAVTGTSMSSMWALGNQIWNFNGAAWTRTNFTLTQTILAAATRNDVTYAVGTGGMILRRDANGWQTMNSGTTMPLRAVAALSATDAFAVGDSGTVLRLQNGTWSPVNTGGLVSFRAVLARSATEVYISGSRDDPYLVQYFRFNGTSWTTMTFADGNGPNSFVDGGTEIYSIGANGMIMRLSGGSWVSDNPSAGNSHLRLGFSDASATVLVGNDGISYVRRAGAWSLNNYVPDFAALWAESPNFMVAGGVRGAIDMFDGTRWSALRGDNIHGITAIWGSDRLNIWAAVAYGTLLRYQGNSWTQVNPGIPNTITSIWGVSRDTVWASSDAGHILRFNGSSWQTVLNGAGTLRAIHGSDSRSIYAVGDGGRIWHFNGQNWTQENSGSTSRLWSVYVADSTNVFAAGDSALLQRVNGVWRDVNSRAMVGFRKVVGSGPRDVYAVGCDPGGMRYDGTAWIPLESTMLTGCVLSGQLFSGGGAVFGGPFRQLSIGVGPLGNRPGLPK